MSSSETHEDGQSGDERFLVVVNDEEQYSIWAEDRELPPGWRAEGTAGSKTDCLDHIERIWTDMRPKSLREALEAGIGDETAPETADDGEPDDALVRRLAEGRHPVVVTGIGEPAAEEAVQRFRERLERGQVQVRFTDTRGGTELGLRFEPGTVDLSGCDFDARSGTVALAGDLNLDGVDVRCEVDVSLTDLAGTGCLRVLSS